MKILSLVLILLSLSLESARASNKKRNFASPPLSLNGINFNPAINPTQLSKECSNFISTTLPQFNWEGGFIEVPEDWSQPTGKKILIFYYFNKVHASENSVSPIVFLNGGPFQSYQSRLPLIKKALDKYDKSQHWMIMLDQRGTGCSANGIPETPVVHQENAKRWARYGSSSIAKDAEAIRLKLLPSARWKVLGHSYGGLPAIRYLDMFPQNVEEMHLYAPALMNSFSDFYFYRIAKEQENIKKFLAAYPQDQLTQAFEKIKSDAGKDYCIYKNESGQPVCGQPVTDLFVANLGQGFGKDAGTMDIWDPIKRAMIGLLKNSDPNDLSDLELKNFYAQALGAGAFFHNTAVNMVYILWAQDISFVNGNPDSDCAVAYYRLRKSGFNPSTFLSDQCRITKAVVSSEVKNALQRNYPLFKGSDKLTHARIRQIIRRTESEIKTYLYTGDLDSVISKDAVINFGQLKSVTHLNFKNSGHAGFLFEPEFWNRLVDTSELGK